MTENSLRTPGSERRKMDADHFIFVLCRWDKVIYTKACCSGFYSRVWHAAPSLLIVFDTIQGVVNKRTARCQHAVNKTHYGIIQPL